MHETDGLRKVPLFSGSSEATFARLAAVCRARDVATGQTILYEGDDGGSLFIVLSGRVSVQKTTSAGRILHLADRGPGEHFGEMSLLDGKPRSADVVAAERCRLLVLNRADFERVVLGDPHLALNMLRILASRLREQSDRVARLQNVDAMGRLCLVLLEEGAQAPVKMTQQALADRIGTSRETVNRSLLQLVDMGVVEMDGRRIRVVDAGYLRERSEPL